MDCLSLRPHLSGGHSLDSVRTLALRFKLHTARQKKLLSFVKSTLYKISPCRLRIRCTLRTPTIISDLENSIPLLPVTSSHSDSFKVTGKCKLSGHVHISGAKNAALAVIAGSLCSSEDIRLRNIPNLLDVSIMLQILKSLGVYVHSSGNDVHINARELSTSEPCEKSVQKIRAGFFVLGALLGRNGEAVLALPGGCAIGTRPIDLHLRGLEALGARVEVRQGKVYAWVGGGSKKLKGGTFCMDFPSVGATESLMMAACLADGKSVLSNVAKEPEVTDLANFLISCGAKIDGVGSNTLVIQGVTKLHGADYTIIPDRIEAGTFLIAAAITRSSLTVSPTIPAHLTSVIRQLRNIGCKLTEPNSNMLQIVCSSSLNNLEVATGPYPLFPTDLQPQLMSLATTCIGQSIVKETIFEKRMGHVEELMKLGARINVTKNMAVIQGTSGLVGTKLKANNLRAGSALILAGMAADGVSIIEGVSHVDRGHEGLDHKLRLLGANIERLVGKHITV